MWGRNFKAIILDLDEVVDQSAEQHARAWKIAFDEYLCQEKKIDDELKHDFSDYIENNPREEAVKNFLDLKNIALPEGKPDSFEANTINGLINKEKLAFLDLINREGIGTFQDAINQIKRWKNRGLKVAVISGEKVAAELVKIAGLENLIDLILDEQTLRGLNLDVKPSPQAYAYICRQMHVQPEETVLIENSVDDIQAARKANFGLIVGMIRDDTPKRELLENGADIVVENMEDLKTIGRRKTNNYEIQ